MDGLIWKNTEGTVIVCPLPNSGMCSVMGSLLTNEKTILTVILAFVTVTSGIVCVILWFVYHNTQRIA